MSLLSKAKFPRGSKLIVESLDRLSREQVLDAFNQFVQIINKGISIVTLTDNMEYSADTINANIGQLMFSLTVMSRAHEESAMKSKRLKAAWKSKRENIKNKKLTSKGPAWLRLNRKKQVFEPIDDRCDLIQRIFQLYLDGNGAEKIAKVFNSEKIPAWKSKNGWHKSYVQKILRNRSVLGEFQPHKLIKSNGVKRREPIGDPIPDYFPKIISDQDFYRAQRRMSENTNKGGRTGKLGNLFGHIAKCGYCGASVQYVDKGDGNSYLVCDHARRGLGCTKTSFRYDEFENVFLEFCRELNLKAVLQIDEDASKRINNLNKEIESLHGQLKIIETKIKNYDHQVSIASSKAVIEHVNENLENALKEEQLVTERYDQAKLSLNHLLSKEKVTSTRLENVKHLLSLLNEKMSGTERIELRQRLRTEIRQLVERLDVFPEGLKDNMLSLERAPDVFYTKFSDYILSNFTAVGYDPDIYPSEMEYDIAYRSAKNEVENYIKENTGKEHRRFAISFKAGGFREVYYDGTNFIVGMSGEDGTKILFNMLKKSPPIESIEIIITRLETLLWEVQEVGGSNPLAPTRVLK